MGLIGWADALNSEQESITIYRDRSNLDYNSQDDALKEINVQPETTLVFEQTAPSNIIDEGLEDSATPVECLDTESCNNPETDEAKAISAQENLQEELFFIIENLKLREDPLDQICDISKIELHEVRFVLNHAARSESLDFYKLVRTVHKVKRQLLELDTSPDTIESPNLDELLDYIEKLYQDSTTDWVAL